jgi:uncharacterized protein
VILKPHPVTIPPPSVSRVDRPFWDGCRNRQLLYQLCEACGLSNFQPAFVCRRCREKRLVWTQSGGRGAIYSWSTVWRPPTRDFEVPFVVAIVALEENFHMMSNIIGCSVDDVSTGLAVQAEFHEIAEGYVLPYFAPRYAIGA